MQVATIKPGWYAHRSTTLSVTWPVFIPSVARVRRTRRPDGKIHLAVTDRKCRVGRYWMKPDDTVGLFAISVPQGARDAFLTWARGGQVPFLESHARETAAWITDRLGLVSSAATVPVDALGAIVKDAGLEWTLMQPRNIIAPWAKAIRAEDARREADDKAREVRHAAIDERFARIERAAENTYPCRGGGDGGWSVRMDLDDYTKAMAEIVHLRHLAGLGDHRPVFDGDTVTGYTSTGE